MNFEELFILALRSIFANKLRSFLTTLGIIIGVFSIILLVSIGSGLQSYITNEISSLGSNIIDVLPGSGGISSGISNKLTIQDGKDLERKLVSTAKVAPVIRQIDNIKYNNVLDKNAFIAGVSSYYTQVVTSLTLIQGNFFTAGQEDRVQM